MGVTHWHGTQLDRGIIGLCGQLEQAVHEADPIAIVARYLHGHGMIVLIAPPVADASTMTIAGSSPPVRT